MESVIAQVEQKYKKKAVVDVRSGDQVRVHQKIREGGKERIQVFDGLVIKNARKNQLMSTITVRRIASGIGVEKTFLLHSPAVIKVEVTKRSKVRRKYLSYMRERTGKRTRLAGMDFDKEAVNVIHDEEAEAEEEKLKEEAEKAHEEKEKKQAEAEASEEVKAQAALAKHDEAAVATPEEQK
jgi:large subunit ribosomal protein L19